MSHVIKNQVLNVPGTPLLLGIRGPAGDGKTFQTEHILRRHGIKAFLISGGQLESAHAGEPAKLIRETYKQAGAELAGKSCSASAVVINDMDTGIGSFGDMVQTTVNTQQLFAEFMHLVDYPTRVAGDETPRVPIIITANDLTKMHAPMVRAGRMTSFAWVPSDQDRLAIVKNIFSDLTEEQAEALFLGTTQYAKKHYPGYATPNALYSQLKAEMVGDAVWQAIEAAGSPASFIRQSRAKSHLNLRVCNSELIERARGLIDQAQHRNHL